MSRRYSFLFATVSLYRNTPVSFSDRSKTPTVASCLFPFHFFSFAAPRFIHPLIYVVDPCLPISLSLPHHHRRLSRSACRPLHSVSTDPPHVAYHLRVRSEFIKPPITNTLGLVFRCVALDWNGGFLNGIPRLEKDSKGILNVRPPKPPSFCQNMLNDTGLEQFRCSQHHLRFLPLHINLEELDLKVRPLEPALFFSEFVQRYQGRAGRVVVRFFILSLQWLEIGHAGILGRM